MQVPKWNGTKWTRHKCSMETSRNLLQGRVRKKGHRLVYSLIDGGLSLYLVRLKNVIKHSWEGNFILLNKIPASTIKLPQCRFQAFFDVSLFDKLIWKSSLPQNETSIRGANPGISYKMWDKDARVGRSWYIASKEQKIWDMEIEIVTFVINGSTRMKLTVPPDRQK